MNRRAIETLLWSATVLLMGLAWSGWSWLPRTSAPPLGTPASDLPVSERYAPRALAAAATAVIQGDPFRLDRTPAPMGFGQTAAQEAPSVPPPEARPALSVQGIIGPPWRAVVEGIPGQDQPAVVRGGESFGALKIRSVTRDRVVIAAPDTVWQLRVRNPWE